MNRDERSSLRLRIVAGGGPPTGVGADPDASAAVRIADPRASA